MKNKLLTTQNLILCGIFTALIAVGAFIRIPVPFVPFTLQVLFTTLAGLLLGPELGAISALLYMFLGLAGLPIFTQGGGLGYLLQPTFGYIIGFCVGTFITGKLAYSGKLSVKRLMFANLAGLLVVYVFGMVYLYGVSNLILGNEVGVWYVFLYGFLLCLPGDIVLCFLAAILGKRLIPILKRR